MVPEESGWIIVPTASLIGVDWTSVCMIVADNPVISYFGFSPKRNTQHSEDLMSKSQTPYGINYRVYCYSNTDGVQ